MLIKIINILGLIPLVIYPFVLLANVMSFAGERSANTTNFNTIISYIFLVLSTLYPISILISWKFNPSNKLLIALLPIFYLITCGISFYIWSNAGKNN
ncbi:hypothetical protein [Chishuiella sp.]|uniref:hypothetical protein n=1 Tax=Chishuiella sp. TaxID=1969467 RepID=UPI0028AC8FB3|nr:hypothetical protein [Chishuiella sp.]